VFIAVVLIDVMSAQTLKALVILYGLGLFAITSVKRGSTMENNIDVLHNRHYYYYYYCMGQLIVHDMAKHKMKGIVSSVD
jgi:surface polysaccharide O-acyltransferase-like enzyme